MFGIVAIELMELVEDVSVRHRLVGRPLGMRFRNDGFFINKQPFICGVQHREDLKR